MPIFAAGKLAVASLARMEIRVQRHAAYKKILYAKFGKEGISDSFYFGYFPVLFFLWGFAHAILDVLNKHFQDVLVITRAHSAWVQVMFYLGYFVMAIPAGLFINKYGYRKGVVFGLLLYG